MSHFWSLLAPPSALPPRLTQLEKIILLCQSVSSGFCWVLSSALHALCSFWLASSLYSVTTVKLDHPQGPNTLLFSIISTWHWFLLERAAKLLQLPLHLILALSADPIFHISGVTALPTQSLKPSERESSFIPLQFSNTSPFPLPPKSFPDLLLPHHSF